MKKCPWHNRENCPVRRTEEAVREYLHSHNKGVCNTNCYGCFIINEAEKDVQNAIRRTNERKD